MHRMQKDDAIGFRVPTALKRALEAAARAEHRSLGQLCTLALIEFLERRGEWRTKSRNGRTRNPSNRGTKRSSK